LPCQLSAIRPLPTTKDFVKECFTAAISSIRGGHQGFPSVGALVRLLHMPVRTDTLPSASTLWSLHQPGDLLDCYSVPSTLSAREAADRGLALPGWARALLGLRNALVRPFGLKTGEPGRPIFPICLDSEDELILGTDDRHLDFRIGLIRAEGRIYMSTWVHPHNLWGRAYLALVMPFHILISRGAVKRMATQRAANTFPNS
jgi:hypothetical protein